MISCCSRPARRSTLWRSSSRLRAVPGIVQFQLVQEERDRFELRCIAGEGRGAKHDGG